MELKECTNTELNFTINILMDNNKNVWFKGNEMAALISYKDTDDAIKKRG